MNSKHGDSAAHSKKTKPGNHWTMIPTKADESKG